MHHHDRKAQNKSALASYESIVQPPTRFRASRYKYEIPWAVNDYSGGSQMLDFKNLGDGMRVNPLKALSPQPHRKKYTAKLEERK